MKSQTIATGLVVLALAGTGTALAQVGSAYGKVVDGDGAPVPEAKVRLETVEKGGGTFAATADDKGEFTISASGTQGPWKVILEKEGYQSIVLPDFVKITFGERTDLGTLTIWKEGDSRAPLRVTEEEAAKIREERKAFEAIQAEFSAADALVLEAKEAQMAGDDAKATAKLAEAEAGYKAIIAKDPSIAEVYFNLAIIYKARRDWETAAATYQKAIERKPGMIEAIVGAAACYQNAGQVSRALELLVESNEKNPNDPNLTFRLGEAFYNNGDQANAKPWLEKATELAPDNAEPYYYLATIALGESEKKAVDLLKKYLSLEPTNAQNAQAAKELLAALK